MALDMLVEIGSLGRGLLHVPELLGRHAVIVIYGARYKYDTQDLLFFVIDHIGHYGRRHCKLVDQCFI